MQAALENHRRGIQDKSSKVVPKPAATAVKPSEALLCTPCGLGDASYGLSKSLLKKVLADARAKGVNPVEVENEIWTTDHNKLVTESEKDGFPLEAELKKFDRQTCGELLGRYGRCMSDFNEEQKKEYEVHLAVLTSLVESLGSKAFPSSTCNSRPSHNNSSIATMGSFCSGTSRFWSVLSQQP